MKKKSIELMLRKEVLGSFERWAPKPNAVSNAFWDDAIVFPPIKDSGLWRAVAFGAAISAFVVAFSIGAWLLLRNSSGGSAAWMSGETTESVSLSSQEHSGRENSVYSEADSADS